MKASLIPAVLVALFALSLPGCQKIRGHEETPEAQQQTIVVTSPKAMEITLTQRYVCQIHSQRHINIRALQDGYLKEILVKEGQPVKKDDVIFRILPTLYEAKYNAEAAEAQVAEIELYNTRNLYKQQVVSIQDVMLHEAKLKRAQAKADLAKAEWKFTEIKAPFDGIVDRLHEREGSLIKERDILTTLSDNSVMWVYFNVPEARYLEFKARQGRTTDNPQQLKLADSRIELVLADGNKFKYDGGDTVTLEAKFNNETGNISFRADFPNPDRLLRHGQTGTVLIHRTQKDALVIPQRATFELLDKRYVWVIGEDHVAHQRLITVQNELEDTFVIKTGLDSKDRIVLEGVREVHEGDTVEYEYLKPEEALKDQKFRAE